MSGTEFEKAAGREKAKKWKTSVRVAPVNGKQGEMVGDWLQVWTACRPKCSAVCDLAIFFSGAAVCIHHYGPGQSSSAILTTFDWVTATFMKTLCRRPWHVLPATPAPAGYSDNMLASLPSSFSRSSCVTPEQPEQLVLLADCCNLGCGYSNVYS